MSNNLIICDDPEGMSISDIISILHASEIRFPRKGRLSEEKYKKILYSMMIKNMFKFEHILKCATKTPTSGLTKETLNTIRIQLSLNN